MTDLALLLEIERLRACLRGVATCCTCGACKGAAMRTLESVAKSTGEGVDPLAPSPGVNVRGLPLESENV